MSIENRINLESQILGGCLIKNSLVGAMARRLTSLDFRSQANSEIFKAMVALTSRGERVDLVTLADELTRRGILDQVGGPVYLAELASSTASASNVERCIEALASSKAQGDQGQQPVAFCSHCGKPLAADELGTHWKSCPASPARVTVEGLRAELMASEQVIAVLREGNARLAHGVTNQNRELSALRRSLEEVRSRARAICKDCHCGKFTFVNFCEVCPLQALMMPSPAKEQPQEPVQVQDSSFMGQSAEVCGDQGVPCACAGCNGCKEAK